MSFAKFNEYINKRGEVVKPKVKEIADEIEGEPHKTPEEEHKDKKKQPQVKEYLDRSGKLVDKPPIEIVPKGQASPPTPPKAVTKGKGWDTHAPTTKEKPKPYVAPGRSETRKTEKGFGDLGNTKYEPDTKEGDSPFVPGGKMIKGYDTKVEQFIEKTKGMSISEFARYLLKEENSYYKNVASIDAYPPKAIKYVVALANENSKALRDLVFEIKRSGCMGKILEEMFEHTEFYDETTRLLEDEQKGIDRCNCLARSMDASFSESVGPPFGIEDEKPKDRRLEDDEDLEDEELDDLEDEELEDEEVDDLEDEEFEDAEDEEILDPGIDDLEDDTLERPSRKRGQAHKNVIDALGSHDYMKDYMKNI